MNDVVFNKVNMDVKKYILFVFILSSLYVRGENSTVELDSEVSLTAIIEKFDTTEHSYELCDTGLDWQYICLIDEKPWFGSDAGMEFPRNELTSLVLNICDKEIELDVSGMFNANWSNYIHKGQFRFENHGLGYMLYGFFSDGAGTYTCHWKIVYDKSIRTRISNDERDFDWQK